MTKIDLLKLYKVYKECPNVMFSNIKHLRPKHVNITTIDHEGYKKEYSGVTLDELKELAKNSKRVIVPTSFDLTSAIRSMENVSPIEELQTRNQRLTLFDCMTNIFQKRKFYDLYSGSSNDVTNISTNIHPNDVKDISSRALCGLDFSYIVDHDAQPYFEKTVEFIKNNDKFNGLKYFITHDTKPLQERRRVRLVVYVLEGDEFDPKAINLLKLKGFDFVNMILNKPLGYHKAYMKLINKFESIKMLDLFNGFTVETLGVKE